MESSMKLKRVGILNIVSSGYEDRYVTADIRLEIEKNGITYRIDSENDRIPAYLELLSGKTVNECTQEEFIEASKIIGSSPIETFITGSTGPFGESRTFKTTSSRIEAGIKSATGYKNLSQFGIDNYKPIAETLNKNEWFAIKTGLDRINKIHAENNRPVIDFTTPGEIK